MSKTGFIPCTWNCSRCRKVGTVDVWPFPDEKPEDAAARHALSSQAACVPGCLYRAVKAARFCMPCERWVTARETVCKECGSDTDKAAK